MFDKLKLNNSEKLYDEALDLIPGAILGIRRPYNFVPGEYPIFFESGKGGRVTDVDGNEYIDMLCAYGPIIFGHREEEVDNAAIAQMQDKGFCMSLTQPVQNQLAAKLRQLIPSAEQSVFVKTGSDGTTTAVRVARGYTGRTKVFRCGYHGWHDWCVEVKGGIPEKLYEDVYEFEYNNLDSLQQLFEQHGSDTACVIITPVGHPLAHEVEMPKPGYLQAVVDMAHKYGALAIFDEIRSGFRVNLGGAQKEFGVTPDLSVFGKALGNGWEIGAVVGKRQYMQVLADKVFLSSTFFPNSTAQVAALKVLEIMERDRPLDDIRKKGEWFASQVQPLVDNAAFKVNFSGGPWMPFITFVPDEKKLYKKLRVEFYTQLIRQGVFLQPYHHGYICWRHTQSDLQKAVDAIGNALDHCKTML